MDYKKMAGWLLTGVASASLMPASALADTAKEAQLEARIEALERATYVAEHAPNNKRGLYTSFIQTTATLGLFAALLVVMARPW